MNVTWNSRLEVAHSVLNHTISARDRDVSPDSIDPVLENIGIQVTETHNTGQLVLQDPRGELVSQRPETTISKTEKEELSSLPGEDTPIEVSEMQDPIQEIAVQTSSKTLNYEPFEDGHTKSTSVQA